MYCERYRCEMSVDVCLARQKKAAAGHAGKIVNFAIMHGSIDPGCIHCAQGKEIQKMGGDTERKCRKCGDTKPIKQFRLNKQCSGGREWTCRACRKITDDERTAARKLAAGEAAEAIAIPAAMTPAGVEPIEPAEIGIPIAGETLAPPAEIGDAATEARVDVAWWDSAVASDHQPEPPTPVCVPISQNKWLERRCMDLVVAIYSHIDNGEIHDPALEGWADELGRTLRARRLMEQEGANG